MSLIWVDWVIIGVLLASVSISFVRGFVREGLSLLSWIAALWLATRYTPTVSDLLAGKISNIVVRLPLSFLIILVTVLIASGLVNKLISALMHRVGLGIWDHLVGACFGFIRGMLIVSVLLLMVQMSSFSESDWWKDSLLIPMFHFILQWMQHLLPDSIRYANISNWHLTKRG